MNDIIKKMQDSNKSWYRKFFADCSWVQSNSKYICPVEWRGKTSANSFCFGNPKCPTDAFEALRAVFPFINRERFNEATDGDGHEWRRITRLHSSSLIAYLMFGQITKEQPLVIRVNDKDVKFTDVHFEVKNPIEDNDTHPSNVDVVLSNNTTILFIESKFTEYLCRSRVAKNISDHRYGNCFRELFNSFDGIKYEMGKDESSSMLVSSDGKSHYIEGLKQVIAHYMGLKYASQKGSFGQKQENINGRRLYFAEIVFDFGDEWSKKARDDYMTLYQRLVDRLPLRDGITVCPKIITYQEVFKDFAVEECVRQFYRLM